MDLGSLDGNFDYEDLCCFAWHADILIGFASTPER